MCVAERYMFTTVLSMQQTSKAKLSWFSIGVALHVSRPHSGPVCKNYCLLGTQVSSQSPQIYKLGLLATLNCHWVQVRVWMVVRLIHLYVTLWWTGGLFKMCHACCTMPIKDRQLWPGTGIDEYKRDKYQPIRVLGGAWWQERQRSHDMKPVQNIWLGHWETGLGCRCGFC